MKLEQREEYAIDYVSELLEMYKQGTMLDGSTFIIIKSREKGWLRKIKEESS